MALSAPKPIYGTHSLTFFNRSTKAPYGTAKVLGSVGLANSGSFNDLFGGSSRYPWASEAGVLDCTITVNFKEYPNFFFTRALGAAVTEQSAETSGNVSTLTNQSGTFVQASTGIASVAATSGDTADLKFGLYVCVATGAKAFDVFCMSDVDFARGTDGAYSSDLLKVGAITMGDTSDTQELADHGLEFTGGSGTVALNTGDSAYFYVRPINGGADLITVGQAAQAFEAFGLLWTAQRQADGSCFEIYVPNAKAIGLPIQLNEQSWSSGEMQIKALYDSTDDCVYKIRRFKAA